MEEGSGDPVRGDACPPVFVVGTGRCGSTLLSQFLRRHPAILSLSELFVFATDLGRRIAETFPDQPMDGAGIWRILINVSGSVWRSLSQVIR